MAEVAQTMQIEAEAAVCGDWSTRLLRCFQGGRQGGGLLSKKKRVTRGASKRAKQLFNSPARDYIKPYYCRKCGFMELYRIENKRFPAVTTENELSDYSETTK